MIAPVQTAVIAAAGFGSRLGHGIPKCLVRPDNQTILEHQFELLAAVPDVRLVVGFGADEVASAALAARSDVTVVVNEDYATTNTVHSFRLAMTDDPGWVLALDGDVLYQPASFDAFCNRCVPGEPLIGIAEATTDEAVFVATTEDDRGDRWITAVSKADPSPFEWAGPIHAHHDMLRRQPGEPDHGFPTAVLAPRFPLRSQLIVAAEVDTPADLRRARQSLAMWADDADRALVR